jgi:hypothetical protein
MVSHVERWLYRASKPRHCGLLSTAMEQRLRTTLLWVCDAKAPLPDKALVEKEKERLNR